MSYENKFIQKFNDKWHEEWTYIKGYEKANSKITIQHKCGATREIQADNTIRKNVTSLQCKCIKKKTKTKVEKELILKGKYKFIKRLNIENYFEDDECIVRCLECSSFLRKKGNALYNVLKGYTNSIKCNVCNPNQSVLLKMQKKKEEIEKEIIRISNIIDEYENIINRYKICMECGDIYYNTSKNSKFCKRCRSDKDKDKRRSLEYINWRNSVFSRDNYTCQCCKDNKGGNLNAHHKNSYTCYENERYNIDNGVTLCEDCHQKFHDIYGYGNNTEKQFNEFIAEQN